MKKLMILAAVAMAAVATQASVVAWGTQTAATLDSVKQTGVLAQLFVVNATGDDILLDYTTTQTMPAGVAGKVGINVYNQSYDFGDVVDGVKLDGTAKIYMKIFDASTEAAAKHYIVSDTMTIAAAGASATSPGDLGDFGPKFDFANGWQTVPEPTSGLLLLLGVAGLALRRRRA